MVGWTIVFWLDDLVWNVSVANGKKIFVKSPARTEFFKNNAPDTPLHPTPVITHGEPVWMPLCIMQKILESFVLW
jgi:hypothetical protein